MPVTTNVGVLDEEVSTACLAVGLLHRTDVAALCGQASVRADLLQCIQDRLVGILRAAGVLPAGVDVITVRVDDVPIARAGKWRPRPAVCSPTRNAVPAGAPSAAACQARSDEDVATSMLVRESTAGTVITAPSVP